MPSNKVFNTRNKRVSNKPLIFAYRRTAYIGSAVLLRSFVLYSHVAGTLGQCPVNVADACRAIAQCSSIKVLRFRMWCNNGGRKQCNMTR